MMRGALKKIGVETDEQDVETCHRLQEKRKNYSEKFLTGKIASISLG